jgi:hypothetical protein
MIGKAVGVLVFGIIFLICFQIYSQVSVSSNTSGYSSMALQATTNWIPLVLLAVGILTIIVVGLSFGKRGR